MAAPRVSLLLAVMLATSVAAADPTAEDKASALELARAGDEAYKAGDFERAADLVKRAYALYPEPLLLYNIALALDGLGKTKDALDYYEQYLATDPNVKDRGAIERRVATMRAQLAAQAEANKPPPPPPPRVEPAPEPASKLPYVTIGVGLATIAGGFGFGALSASRHDDAETAPSQLVAQQQQDRAQLYATTANIMFVAGGVIAVGGVIWAVLDRPKRASDTSGTKIVVGPSSIGVAWTFR